MNHTPRSYLRFACLAFLLIIGLGGCATKASHFKGADLLQGDLRIIDGAPVVPLGRICDAYRIDWTWDQVTRIATLEAGSRRIVLREGGRVALIDGTGIRLARPPFFRDGALYVSADIPGYLIETGVLQTAEAPPRALSGAPVARTPFTIKEVVIDPGHGGGDVGARSKRYGLLEKDLTLAIARRLKSILSERGLRTTLTRDTDKPLSLEERSRIANASTADLFVSVHANASRSKTAGGFECYYLSDAEDDTARALEAAENGPPDIGGLILPSPALNATLWDLTLTENHAESKTLAGTICASARAGLSIRNRGVKSAMFRVLRHTRVPSVLVEVGFLTNNREAVRMTKPAYVETIAGVIADGICAYKAEYEKTNGFTV